MRSSKRVAIVDYGVGNHQSVVTALEKLGYKVAVSHRSEDLDAAAALIFPGVGAFSEAMARIRERNLADVLRDQVLAKKKPILGICLGMQLLAESSTENGKHEGLRMIRGHVVELPRGEHVKVPHVGWSPVRIYQRDALFANANDDTMFYFDHSFHFACDPDVRAATVSDGAEVVAAVQCANIFGVQFHPEKSDRSGLKLFRSFFNHCGIKGRPC